MPVRGSIPGSRTSASPHSTRLSTLIRGKAGLFPELKTPELYEGRDVRFEELVATALDKHKLRGPSADPKTPVILQTFGEASARKLAEMKIGVPVVLLIGNPAGWDSIAKVHEWKGVVQGLGPAKNILLKNPDLVKWAHAEGMSVTPYTFRSNDVKGFPTVTAEMEHYLYTLGVDALFTDNPDKFPGDVRVVAIRCFGYSALGSQSAFWRKANSEWRSDLSVY